MATGTGWMPPPQGAFQALGAEDDDGAAPAADGPVAGPPNVYWWSHRLLWSAALAGLGLALGTASVYVTQWSGRLRLQSAG
eukprot:7411711-Lingulodinium_polyedra.AAC.1